MTARLPAVGVDVGGTKVAAGLVAPDGSIGTVVRRPTRAREGGSRVVAQIEDVVREVMAAAAAIAGVGIGTGGVVDAGRGMVVASTDLITDWAGTDIAGPLSRRLGVPVSVDNDGNALASGETTFGAARGVPDALCVAVGTGIGGGLVLDGVLRRGPHHVAGAIGHLPARTDGVCSCGVAGHVEAVASGPAMTRIYRGRGGDADDFRDVVAAADRGEADAIAVIAEGGLELGRTLAGVVTAFDIEVVVLGGGVPAAGALYVEAVVEAFHGLQLHGRRTPVLAAHAGPDASVVGAACLVLGG